MVSWFFLAAEKIASVLYRAVPPLWRGLVPLQADMLHCAKLGQKIQVKLPKESILLRSFDLPRGDRSVDDLWLSSRIDAVTPWESDCYFWDAIILRGEVRLALIPQQLVREATEKLAECGAKLREVVSEEFCFLHDVGQVRCWRDRMIVTVAIVTGLATGLAIFGIQLGLQAEDRTISAQNSLVRMDTRLKRDAGPATDGLALLMRKKTSLSLTLARLATDLPQSCFLTSLSADSKEFAISGRTNRLDAIIPALSGGVDFARVDFAGPAAHNPDDGSYTFTIRGDVVTQ